MKDLIPAAVISVIALLGMLLLHPYMTAPSAVSQKVDSRWDGGPDTWTTSLDYMGLHPVCRDALRSYVVTNSDMVAYMCNMVGDIWVTDLIMKENTP